jgi:hypothetical protein
VVTRRPTLLELIEEAAPRIATMGRDAIAECHAAGHPAWVEDRDTGRIVRLNPDGSRDFVDVARDVERDLGDSPPIAQGLPGSEGGRPRATARFASEVQVDPHAAAPREREG